MTFLEELEHLINRESMENGSNTPDYILAHFLDEEFKAIRAAIEEGKRLREAVKKWKEDVAMFIYGGETRTGAVYTFFAKIRDFDLDGEEK